MNCKNCGARIKDTMKICPVCGALLDDEANYTLLTTDERYDDVYSDAYAEAPPKRRHSGLKTFFVILLVMLLAGGGAYYYFAHIRPAEAEPPTVHFTAGSGMINRDQPVIYVTLDNPDIEYIHGVNLYAGDLTAQDTAEGEPAQEPVTTEYEYTKNIDTTFRAIYFDTTPLNLQKDKEYTYTFEMVFSFIGSDEMVPYRQSVTFSGDIKDSAADIVFDHSLTQDTAKEESATQGASQAETTTETTTKAASADFIYEGYWFTAPYTENNTRSISCFKFNKDKSYKVTHYDKKGNEDWVIYSEDGKYELNDGAILLDDGARFTVDAAQKSIYEESNGKKTNVFTSRKYNSRQNAEDFFGI